MKDTQGRWLTQALFWEHRLPNYDPIFTLKEYDLEKDGVVYKSLKKLYLEEGDAAEYIFATKYLGGWPHWQKMCGTQMLRPFIDEWRKELEIKMKATAIKAIAQIAIDSGNKGQLSAAKYIAEKGWEPNRGRPSKEEITRQQKIHAGLQEEINADLERVLKGNVVKLSK